MYERITAGAAAAVSQEPVRVTVGSVAENTKSGAKVYTGEASVCDALEPWHDRESVKCSVHERVNGMARTNGIGSFWSMFKRGCVGTFHHMSPQHLHRYVNEFAGRHNIRNADTADMMARVVKVLQCKQLRYNDLIADNGLSSGARA